MRKCSILGGTYCPELKLETCENCELSKTWDKYKLNSSLLMVLDAEANAHQTCGECPEFQMVNTEKSGKAKRGTCKLGKANRGREIYGSRMACKTRKDKVTKDTATKNRR